MLVVGESVPDSASIAITARWCAADAVQLPMGVYVFDDGAQVEAMVVTQGAAPATPAQVDWTAESHPLHSAYDWLGAWWDDASHIAPPLFEVNSPAVTRGSGQEAVVRDRDYDRGQWWYRIRVEGRTVTVAERDLQPPEIDDDPYQWIARPPARVDRFAATLTRAKLREQLTDTVYSFRATKTIFRAYQFRPVIRLLETGQLRLLIADEVGLGKTIEAGLVWTELDARRQADRVLVVCPSMLVPKWRAEMRERFDYELEDLDRSRLDEMLERIDEDRMPSRFAGVCSLERLRVWSGLEDLAELAPRFDLVVVDEAHAFRNSETKSYALGALLSDWADALIFLSATPLNLGNEDLFSLLQILAPGEFDNRFVLEQRLEPNAVLHDLSASFFDDAVTNSERLRLLRSIESLDFGPAVSVRPEYRELMTILQSDTLLAPQIALAKRLIGQLHALSAVVTRTRRVEVQERKAVRDAVSIPVEWTDPEAAFYDAFERWQIDRARALRLPVGFVTQMPLRLASSCLPAARDRVLNWRDERGDEDLDATDDDVSWDIATPPAEVLELAHSLGDVDTKFDSFLAHLRPVVESRRQVLVFTFSRRALAYLSERLSADYRIAVMHGGVDREARHDIMRMFRDREFDILLASRVASEGLDFEFCSAVFNYDLPWNPMEVEQRIGRVDRFGQMEEKILVFNFHTPGTIESDIIERVHQRIGVFKDSIGELEPILQSRIGELRRAMFDFSLTDAERERRLNETLAAIEEQRLAIDDIEVAASFLSSTDAAEIDGLEEDLLETGRYIGQPELVHLLRDWAAGAPGAHCEVDSGGTHLTFRGTAAMELHLRGVQSAGERSRTEIDELAKAILDERDLVLCLDPEHARKTGQRLLSATNPLVRAALRVPGSSQARFSHIGVKSSAVTPGSYLVLVAVARWVGLRPSVEFWTAAVDLDTGVLTGEDVGSTVLAALAESQLEEQESPPEMNLDVSLRDAERSLRQRQQEESLRREAMNTALVESRRISLRETHARKVAQIGRRIETLKERGTTGVIHLQEAQRSNQDRLLREAEERLDKSLHCRMDVETIAVCVAEVNTR
ncbi:MAG: DEAD/DEAH box helicase [Acidimicrobiales bacterium]|nr:DEAD/DEAH box helicase [Acidimicrobiales bacterium]MYD84400.1 DEAD/DEAH box helicase [Acidimicrobiales bacterium]MYJ64934.1 DEAD/DEAH box helicase [Acidimicrobiales bacterium]